MPMHVYACTHSRIHARMHTQTHLHPHIHPPPHIGTPVESSPCQPSTQASVQQNASLSMYVRGIPFVPTKAQVRQPATSFESDSTPLPHTKENTSQHSMYAHKPCTYLLYWAFIVSTTHSSVHGGNKSRYSQGGRGVRRPKGAGELFHKTSCM